MRRAGGLALLGYLIPASILAVPLPLLFSGSRLLGDGDAWLFVWNMWWLDFALENGQPLLCSQWIYHPHGACLYLQTTVFSLSLPSVLLQDFLGRVQIYNLFAWGSFVLAGWGMYRLGLRLGLSHSGAWSPFQKRSIRPRSGPDEAWKSSVDQRRLDRYRLRVYTYFMREARLFKNGQSQAVRLPKEFRLPGDSVYIRRLGRIVMLIPKEQSWDSLEDACNRFSEDFMDKRDQGVQEREAPFG